MVRLTGNTTDNAVATTVGGDYKFQTSNTLKSVELMLIQLGPTGTMTNRCPMGWDVQCDLNKITLDTTREKSSGNSCLFAPALTDTAIAADAIITFDVDAIHLLAAKGLVVWID